MVDPSLFKSGMRRLASGVSLVTTLHEGQRHGLIATSVCSVSTEPPSLLVCVNRSAMTHAMIHAAGRFCVNLLASSDNETARRFSDPHARDLRFEGRDWTTLLTGAPALVGALASFDCEIATAHRSGSHTIFVGNVIATELWHDDISPLIYVDGRYATSAPRP
jgi:flavin reductase